MPCPIRFGPEPRMSTFGRSRRRDLGLLVVGRVVVRRAARRTRRRRCRRSCRPAGRRAGAAASARRPRRPAPGRSAASCRSDRPCPLGPAQQRRRRAPARRRSRARSSTSAAIWSTNHGSMPGRRGDLLDGRARRAAPARRRRAGRRAGRAARSSSSSASRRPGPAPVQKPAALVSIERSALPQRLGEVAADRHRLADRLHRAWSARGRRRGTSRTRTAGSSPPRSPASARTPPGSRR